jgi:transposase
MERHDDIRRRYNHLVLTLDERGRRMLAAAEAKMLGYGGVSALSRITGLPRNSIAAAISDLDSGETLLPGRIRKPGGGRKRKRDQLTSLVEDVETLVEPDSRGDPESPLRWTIKSLRQLTKTLRESGHDVSRRIVADILHDLGYSLQANTKTLEGKDHPDRDAQFRHINKTVKRFMASGDPVISVDTKKKELVGEYENKGREGHFQDCAEEVQSHDFPGPGVGHAHPYGVYDIARNQGFVNLGTDHDTATFAVASIHRWWRLEGKQAYSPAKRLMITADGGGSNGSRLRLWKWELQRLADELRFPISVSHFPPGTSKWNKVEHRLFSFISINWRGKPLTCYETIVNLISRTTTCKGLSVMCKLDKRHYPTGQRVSKKEMAKLKIEHASFHGNWNYTITPR